MDDPSQLFNNNNDSSNNTEINAANTELAATQTPFKGKTTPTILENAETNTKLDRPSSSGFVTAERNSEKQSS